jgi:prepilin-type N-terminal cleavage/methylation domain-containing protein
MSKRIMQRQNGGFTLVELLVVSAIMGLVAVAMFSIFLAMNKSTFQQEEYVEIQQNLRVAMGQVVRDIRMAGFLIPLGSSPFQVADANTLTIRNATISGRMAQILTQFNSLGEEETISISISTPGMVDLFDSSDHKYVRIIRPADRGQPVPGVLTVSGKDRTVPSLQVSGFDAYPATTFRPGDLIVEVASSGAAHPELIAYWLADGNLQRNGEVVASYLTGISFQYLRADGSSIDTPVVAGELDDIRAVLVTMTAATDPLKTGLTDGVKSRQLTMAIRIRNQL